MDIFALWKPQRSVGRVIRGEEDCIALTLETLQNRFVLDQGHHDLARHRHLLPAHNGDIAGSHSGGHAVGEDPDGKAIAAAQPEDRHRDIIHYLVPSEHRRPGGHSIVHGEVSDLLFGGERVTGWIFQDLNAPRTWKAADVPLLLERPNVPKGPEPALDPDRLGDLF